jgi:hypothetical protein
MLRSRGSNESQLYITKRVMLCCTVSQSQNYTREDSAALVFRPSLGNALERRPPDGDISGGHGAFACNRFISFVVQDPYILWDLNSHHIFGMTIEPFGM